ncbi:hypothetical protein G1L02_12705 [Tenacibaculum finnmarkense]|uniref:hypothetical protein n=1 Tax=Tenacibaculum finnmarkense TaxID=2781243 RepID=UPI001EFB4A38|nr:hypothetical protein [Tenacibaculum finnmarkense]MCG8884012.1 hypothetical protein [Tenacibaculum finnmarkense]
MEELKKKAITEVGKPILNPLGWFLTISLMAFISFPFVWIWVNLWLAVKISVTAFILLILLSAVYKFIEKQIKTAVDNEFEKNPPSDLELGKSKFRQKLDAMMEQQKSTSS